MAHKPSRRFGEDSEEAEQARQDAANQSDTAPAQTEVKVEATTQETAAGCGAPVGHANKPDNIFGCDTEGEEFPDWGVGEAEAAQTETEQDAPAPTQNQEKVIETTMAKLAERMYCRRHRPALKLWLPGARRQTRASRAPRKQQGQGKNEGTRRRAGRRCSRRGTSTRTYG